MLVVFYEYFLAFCVKNWVTMPEYFLSHLIRKPFNKIILNNLNDGREKPESTIEKANFCDFSLNSRVFVF